MIGRITVTWLNNFHSLLCMRENRRPLMSAWKFTKSRLYWVTVDRVPFAENGLKQKDKWFQSYNGVRNQSQQLSITTPHFAIVSRNTVFRFLSKSLLMYYPLLIIMMVTKSNSIITIQFGSDKAITTTRPTLEGEVSVLPTKCVERKCLWL